MATQASSVKAVVAALAGNAFVTAIKLVAFLLSGSGAMLSEAIHSAADTGNQLLLFLGLKRAARAADDRFPYGYGGERFIFGILSASGIFFVGCGITLYHGIRGLLYPHMPTLGPSTFAVLGLSFLVEGSVLLYAVRSLGRERGDLPFFRYVRDHADPAAVAILLEDGAAVTGLCLAGAGITAAYLTGNPMYDALGTLVVGVVLGAVAVYLVAENRELLLGKAVAEGIEDRFVAILCKRPAIRQVRDVKTRQLTPEVFTLKAEITFDEAYLASRLDQALPRDCDAIQGTARVTALRGLSAAAVKAIADEIAAIEVAVRAEMPGARHIDLEVAYEPPQA